MRSEVDDSEDMEPSRSNSREMNDLPDDGWIDSRGSGENVTIENDMPASKQDRQRDVPAAEGHGTHDSAETDEWEELPPPGVDESPDKADGILPRNMRVQESEQPNIDVVVCATDYQDTDRATRVDSARAKVVTALDQAPTDDVPHPEDTPEVRDDFRREALEQFELDESSQNTALELGVSLTSELPPGQWEDGDFLRRASDMRLAEQDICQSLDLPRGVALLDSDMSGSLLGSSQGDIVRINPAVLIQDTPIDMIETLAHEYRHQWQDSVIKGDISHPLGQSGRDALIQGSATYDADSAIPDRYASNSRELDAEAFARLVSLAYNRSRNDRH